MSAQEWVNIGRWVLDPAGASAALPVVCTRPPAVEPPARLPAWSWRQVHWSPGAQGGQLLLEGEGAVEESWAAADETLHTLVAATGSGCEITSGAGGPVGEWEVASAQGFGQVMGARGVSFTFKANGALEVVLADAFVGPLAAVAVAGEVGTSGVVHGRWWVCGPQAIAFGGIASHSLTMHGRRSERFMVPAKGFGLGEWLEALEEGPWAWEAANARLVMRGQMMGGMVEVRLRRVR